LGGATQLQGRLDAFASVTANLYYYDNQQLHRQLGGRHAITIAALPAAD